MAEFIYGIDIGGTSIKFGLFTLKGTLLRKWAIDTNLKDSGSHILKEIAQEIKQQPESIDKIHGVGFGVPGPVKEDVVYRAVNLGWDVFDVKKEFLSYFKTSFIVKVHNDANVAALGEQAFGAGKAYPHMVLYTLGTGVGGGVIYDGTIIEGAFGAGGEVGHMFIKDFPIVCGCGNTGCLETLASASAVKNLVSYYIKTTPLESKLRNEDSYSAKHIFDLAKSGDLIALKVVDTVAEALAKASQIISVIVNPNAFVFGGGVSLAGDFLIHKIERRFKEIAFKAVKNDTVFTLAKLGNDAGIYGCYQAVKNHG
jgi:glucokinase